MSSYIGQDCTITAAPATVNTITVSTTPYTSTSFAVAYDDIYKAFGNVRKEIDSSNSSISIAAKDKKYHPIFIRDVEVLAPDKVVRVTIEQLGKMYTYKQVCKDPDVFDLRFAVALGIVKFFDKETDMYHYRLTREGREVEARRLCDIYETTSKAIDRAIKDMEKKGKAKEKAKKCAAEIKAIKERRREKNKRKRERRRIRAIAGE